MRIPNASLLVIALSLPMALPVPPAAAADAGALAVEILVDGRPLAEYAARGTTYVEALAGREYSLRLRNHSGGRLAVALAVDGLNSIDARAGTAWSASKWVLGPWQSVTIDGWQTSSATARRFVFTTEERSYGAWLGHTRDLGLITAVAFRERPLPPPRPWAAGESRGEGSRRQEKVGGSAGAPAPQLSEDMAATGIGRQVDNPVRRVQLELDPDPVASVRLRYEYRPELVRLGVLPLPPRPDPLARRESAQGFSGLRFAPDPYSSR